jgi:hypothetical protein
VSHRLLRRSLPFLLSAPAIGLMSADLGRAPHGEHLFRQTHVAANIEKFVDHGLSLRPETYNQDAPLAVFDFPVYAWFVAAVCRILGSPAVATARAVNILLFVVALFALDRLLRRCGAGATQRLFGVLVFAYAPIDLLWHSSFTPTMSTTWQPFSDRARARRTSAAFATACVRGTGTGWSWPSQQARRRRSRSPWPRPSKPTIEKAEGS